MIDKLASASVFVAASASAATVSSATGGSIISIIAPIAVACLAATFARATSIFQPTSSKNKVWAYEIPVLALCVLLSGAMAYDHSWSVGQAASYGGGIGFIGAGLKPLLEGVVKSLFATIAAAVSKDDPKP